MDGLRPLLDYHETINELEQKVIYKTMELESLKTEASEQIHRQKEDIKHLINRVRLAHQERDRYERLLNMLMPSWSTEVLPTKANSVVTESKSTLSETTNSHVGSPPVDSFLDMVSSSFSINAAAYSRKLGTGAFGNQTFNGSNPYAGLVPNCTLPVDAVIESLLKGKSLPQKGKLLQAVTEAGPLLQSLLDSGPPLPRWTNPPPILLQPLEIPPATINRNQM